MKDRRGHQIIQTCCRIGSPQKSGPHSLICGHLKSIRKKLGLPSLIFGNLKTLRKVLLNHAECTEINKWPRIWVIETLEIEIQKGRGHGAVTWVEMIFSPLTRAVEFYTKQPVSLPKGKKQKFNHPQLGLGTYLFDWLKKPRRNGGPY